MSVEQEEAKAAMDKLASEIHDVYVGHGKEAGIDVPSWEDLPEEQKGMCRTLARLSLAKMGDAYNEGRKDGIKSVPPSPPSQAVVASPVTPGMQPKRWTKKEVIETAGELAAIIEHLLKKDREDRSMDRSPVLNSVDEVMRETLKECAKEVIKENPEIRARLKELAEKGLTSALFGGEEEES